MADECTLCKKWKTKIQFTTHTPLYCSASIPINIPEGNKESKDIFGKSTIRSNSLTYMTPEKTNSFFKFLK